jgi:hypothetical protein
MQPCRTCLARTQELMELCPLTEEHCEFKRRAKRARKAHIVEKSEEPYPQYQRRQAKAAAR